MPSHTIIGEFNKKTRVFFDLIENIYSVKSIPLFQSNGVTDDFSPYVMKIAEIKLTFLFEGQSFDRHKSFHFLKSKKVQF